ncbi:MAG: TonB-dependent receptor [Bacteroidales bacterium]|jgi:iron complex outermembrane receptor protein|nr:TonB-dependent receptor [Bacteroidales bacterium]
MIKNATIVKGIVSAIFMMVFMGTISAQNQVRGTVKDAVEGFPIPYAQIYVNCNSKVELTDMEGKFTISIPKDSCEIEFRSGMYQPLKRIVVFKASNRDIKLDVKLESAVTMLDPANITASKYETNPEQSTASLVVLTPKSMENKNLTNMSEVLNTAGGVAVVDNEPQIRGGSGFSSGMGSRVMILLDNMPLLRPDAGRPMWNFIPMEDVEQVEILKGAASVVFGSSALTGAINVLTAYPRLQPKTKVAVFAGIYSKPKNQSLTSWNHHNPIKYGVSFLHSRIIKKNFDFVIGGEYYDDQSYVGPEERISETRDKDGSTVGKFERRARLNFATRYRFKKNKGLSVSLNGNAMYSNNAQSFFWFDGMDNRYRTYKGSLSKFQDFTFYVDPVLKYNSSKGYMHSFRNRFLFSNNKEASGAQDAGSFQAYNEYQFNKNINKIGLNIVGGFMNMYAESKGRVFSGDNYSDDAQKITSDNFAMYAQLEEKLLKYKNLTLQAGMRWEFYMLNDAFEQKPVFRAGLNYQILKSKTAFRASWGQGYRYPSIGEKYISISVGKYGFYPNPQLESEKSWNAEVGVMQPFMFFDFRGMADIAVYHQNFKNYIEFAMGPWGNSGNPVNDIGFMFLNTGPAAITGIDFALMGEGKISKNVTYTLSVSYTFSHPVSKDTSLVYFEHNKVKYSFHSSASDLSRSVLKYRIEHIARLDLEFTFFKKWRLGTALNYMSQMKNLDKVFFNLDIERPGISEMERKFLEQVIKSQGGSLPFTGVANFMNEHKLGSLTMDVRTSYDFKQITLALIVKNIFNAEYTLRPMCIEPPRTFTFQINYNLN